MSAPPELPEVELAGETLAVADLHLEPDDAPGAEAFAAWTRGLDVGRLMILGDLFDAWVGPAHEAAPGARRVIEALAALAGRGVEVDVLQGNRDFLLGESFARASRALVRPDGLVARLGSARLLFLHGDELCTRDRAYQRLRRLTHSRLVQGLGPRLPLFLTRRVAARLRRASKRAVARKPSEEKAIQHDAVRAQAARHRAETLVCGHAHEARDLALDGGPRFLVLDAFGAGPRDALRLSAGGAVELVASAP